MERAYFDESANSGENLVDPHQPVFALAAVCLSAEEAATLVQSVQSRLPRRQGEPKYSSLVRSRAGRAALLSTLESLQPGKAFNFFAHKRFMIVSKMIDLLIVELAFEDGYDMYADGSAVALANLMYMAGPVLGDGGAFERMLGAFVDALRPNRPTSLNDLFSSISAYRATTRDGLGDWVALLVAARRQAESLIRSIEARKVSDTLDPALPCLVRLCDGVADKIGRFHLIHDHSKIISKHASLLMNIDELPPVTPNLALKFPVADITFADSATTPQLQVADWVAGASRHVAHAVVTGSSDPYTSSLKPMAESWMVDGIWPNPDLIVTPRRL
ncbi:DUF3800 domain-containing protein [Krasilnikovia sp. M28-CT-15]|uniref:DUF3800 domain-containing protein n=1 Tax=Krasilnikovia sp. M28-CT-15 TaxID=3373540 RepID=UPI00399C9B60